jgi:iron complex outermembrane recepter protein
MRSVCSRFMGAAALLFVGLLLLGSPSAAEAQTGTVSGQVVTQDGTRLGGVQVLVVGTGRGAATDPLGQFRITGVPAGSHTLRVRLLGYETAEVTVEVSPGATVSRTIQLTQGAIALDAMAVTVGSRIRHTAAEELAVPVDVYTRSEILRASPQMEMGVVLQELSPAIFFPRPQIADVTSGVRPFQLRGLSPDHSLVLVNGKRRHSTAIIHVFGAGSGGAGSSGVDMNAFVPAALGGMEILRDGAAAQYGSDAIAGVINLQLRSDVHSPEFNVTLGQYTPKHGHPRDGERAEIDGSYGFALGDRGTLVLSGMYSQREPTDRAGADPRDQIEAGDADLIVRNRHGINTVVGKVNPAPQTNHLIGDGRTKNIGGFWNMRYALNEERSRTGYMFGGYTWRRDVHSGFYRRGIDNRNWPEIHPVGFLPKFRGDASDLMVAGGIEGELMSGWQYDVSAQWNRNWVDIDIFNSHNVSLGPCLDTVCAPGPWPAGVSPMPNKTDMYAGSVGVNQAIVSLDVVREFDVGFYSPLNVAVGTAFRRDNFQLESGEPASWVNGGHLNRAGGIAPPGSQVFFGWRPDQVQDEDRDNVGVYLDLESDLTRVLRVAVAGRFENYSDFGSTVTGKVATRVQASDNLIFRAAASTGFRAPNLNQSYYSHVTTNFRADPDNPGNQIAFEVGEMPVSSPEAQALGAVPLKEEKSENLSAGLAFSPTENLTFTVDGYQIKVYGRIIMTGNLSGPTVEALLAPFAAEQIRFFTNSLDTRTRGVDVSARYRQMLMGDRYVEFLGQYNRNRLKVTGVDVPPVIDEIRDQVFTEGNRIVLEEGRPKDRATLRTRFVDGGFDFAVSANYYGTQSERLLPPGAVHPVCSDPPSKVRCLQDGQLFLDNGPHIVFNADVAFNVSDRWRLQAGAENLTNRMPPVRPAGVGDFSGIFPYSNVQGISVNGRYLWTRMSFSL